MFLSTQPSSLSGNFELCFQIVPRLVHVEVKVPDECVGHLATLPVCYTLYKAEKLGHRVLITLLLLKPLPWGIFLSCTPRSLPPDPTRSSKAGGDTFLNPDRASQR